MTDYTTPRPKSLGQVILGGKTQNRLRIDFDISTKKKYAYVDLRGRYGAANCRAYAKWLLEAAAYLEDQGK